MEKAPEEEEVVRAVDSSSDSSFSSSSKIRYVRNEITRQEWRQGHLMALLPLSRKKKNKEDGREERILQEFRVYVELSAFLAYRHIQHRTIGRVLPTLSNRLDDCDFQWTYTHHDTQFSPLQAAREVLTYQLPNLLSSSNDYDDDGGGGSDSYNIINNSSNSTEIHSTWFDLQSLSTDDDYDDAIAETTLNTTGSATMVFNDFGEPVTINNTTTIVPTNSSLEEDEHPPPQTTSTTTTTTSYPQRMTPGSRNRRKQRRTRTRQTPPPRVQRHLQQQAQQSTTAATMMALKGDDDDDDDDDNNNDVLLEPFAVVGAARSVVSQAVGILGSAFDLPQISSSSTASNLDDLPFFARTVPTNQGDAHATIVYLQNLGISHVGVLFLEDQWGRRYEQDLQYYATLYGKQITVKSVAYTNTPEGIDQAMTQLQNFDLRYFIGILNPSAWKPVVQRAYDFGLIGQPHRTWLIADLVELVGDGFALDSQTERDIATALHGTGVVFVQVTPHELFDQALSEVANNPQLQQEFIESHSDPELLENFTFSNNPGMSLFQYLTFDAVVALGITACDTPGLFTGKQFYDQLLQVDFQGVSGRVNLHGTTGTRLGDSLKYQIVNMVLKEDDELLQPTTTKSSTTISFSSDISSLIELSPQSDNGTTLPPTVHSIKPFVYFNNGTTPPPALQYLNQDLNLIPDGVLYFGLSLSVMVMLLSVVIAVWIYLNQKRYVIRASQPFFMLQLCAGVFILAATIIPMGWQEPKKGLDAACMITPWLFSIGFSVAISALFGKARRINQVVGVGTGFRRCKVKPTDVMKPFFFLMCVNTILLTAWSASPWRISWHRIAVSNNVDQFGRSQESYGVCRADGKWHFFFSVPLVFTNIMFLIMATWQSYRARALPSELSEANYLAVSMVSLSEVFWLGLTIVFTVISHPTSFYLTSSVMITVGCMAILVPMFGPKFLNRNMKEPRGRMATSIMPRNRTPSNHSGNRLISGLELSERPSLHGSGSGFRVRRTSAINDIRGSIVSGVNISGLNSALNSSALSAGSLRRSTASLSSGTFHATTRRSNEEIAPFGSSQNLRATTEHVPHMTPNLSLKTHQEEVDPSCSSFG